MSDHASPTGPTDDTVAVPRRRPSRVRALLTLGLLVALVVAGLGAGFLGYRLANPTDAPFSPASGPVLPSDRDRASAVATAEQFTLRMDNVDGANFDEYVESVNQMLTTKAQGESAETLEVMKQAYEETEVQGTGEVLVSAVSTIDADSATVLVAHDAQVTTTQGDIQHYYRWAVDLARVDGAWMVDAFNQVS